MPQLIVTAVGRDRPGLVADLSRHVHDVGANLTDSRMVNLGGHFALLARVEGAAEAIRRLRSTLAESASSLGLRIELLDIDALSAPRGGIPYRLKTYSFDQPGIVAAVTEVLRSHHANVEELETRVAGAAFEGTPIFTMEAVIVLPKGSNVRALRSDLGALGERISCDVDLEPLSAQRP